MQLIFPRSDNLCVFRKQFQHHVVHGFDYWNGREYGHEGVQGVERIDFQATQQVLVSQLFPIQTPASSDSRNAVIFPAVAVTKHRRDLCYRLRLRSQHYELYLRTELGQTLYQVHGVSVLSIAEAQSVEPTEIDCDTRKRHCTAS